MHARRQFTVAALSATAALLGAQRATALPLPTAAQAAAARTVTQATTAGDGVDFSAIVALDDCSGSLVRFATSQPTDKAMVLTNGHCYEGGFLDAGQVLVNLSSSRTFDLLSSDASSTLGTLQADQILYATMTTTDVTLYRLTATYADIQSQYNVAPLTIASQHPTAGTAIDVVSGYWKKIYSCAIDGFVFELKESDWTWKDSIRYTEPGCEVIGGTSGSPIIASATKEIVGINNTINEDGERCTLDNPCEVDTAGAVKVTPNVGYGQELHLFYSCLTAANTIDLTLQGCQLPSPASSAQAH